MTMTPLQLLLLVVAVLLKESTARPSVLLGRNFGGYGYQRGYPTVVRSVVTPLGSLAPVTSVVPTTRLTRNVIRRPVTLVQQPTPLLNTGGGLMVNGGMPATAGVLLDADMVGTNFLGGTGFGGLRGGNTVLVSEGSLEGGVMSAGGLGFPNVVGTNTAFGVGGLNGLGTTGSFVNGGLGGFSSGGFSSGGFSTGGFNSGLGRFSSGGFNQGGGFFPNLGRRVATSAMNPLVSMALAADAPDLAEIQQFLQTQGAGGLVGGAGGLRGGAFANGAEQFSQSLQGSASQAASSFSQENAAAAGANAGTAQGGQQAAGGAQSPAVAAEAP